MLHEAGHLSERAGGTGRGCGYAALDLNTSGENLTFGSRQKRLGPTRSGHCDAEQRMAQVDPERPISLLALDGVG